MRFFILFLFSFSFSSLAFSSTYQVKKGDTLYSLSKKYNKNIEWLKEINQIRINQDLKIGQSILLSIDDERQERIKKKEDYFFYQVKKGDTLYSLSKRFNRNIKWLKEINQIIGNQDLKIGQILYLNNLNTGALKPLDNRDSYKNKEEKSTLKSISLLDDQKENGVLYLPLKNGKIITEYGKDKNSLFRAGIQLRSDNRGVFSIADGKLIFKSIIQGYGLTLIVEHKKGHFTIYSSLNMISNLKVGKDIKKGEMIGESKNKSINLFFQLWFENQFQNPLNYYIYRKFGVSPFL